MNKANERSKTKRNIDKQTGRQGDRETVTHAAQYKQTNTHTRTCKRTHTLSQVGSGSRDRGKDRDSNRDSKSRAKLANCE